MDAIPGGVGGRSEPAIRSVRCGSTWRRALGRSGRRSVRHCASTSAYRGDPRTWLSARRAIFSAELRCSSRRVCILQPNAGWFLISSELLRRGWFSVQVPQRPRRRDALGGQGPPRGRKGDARDPGWVRSAVEAGCEWISADCAYGLLPTSPTTGAHVAA